MSPACRSARRCLACPAVCPASHSRGAPPLLDEVGSEKGDVVFARRALGLPVDEDHRDAGRLCGLERRRESLVLARREQDESDAARDQVLDVGDLLGGLALRVGDDEVVMPRFAASALMLAVCASRQGLLCSICEKPTTNARSCRRQPPVERAITAATVPHMVFRQRRRRVMRPDVGRSRGAGLETGCAKWRNQRVCPGQTACQEPTRRTRTHSATPEDCYALSSRAALAIAGTFAAAISAVFIGRLENVPKPQSGFRKICSGA